MDSEAILNYLLEKKQGMVVLDGYSGCGKTMCLKKLKTRSSREVMILSYRDVIDVMIKTVCNCDDFLLELCEEDSVICIEDVDYLAGKNATQEYLAKMVQIASEKHLVVMTGNSVKIKAPILCQICNPEIQVWT